MRFAGLLLGFAIAVAVALFAIYTFGWREDERTKSDGRTLPEERAQALAYGREVADTWNVLGAGLARHGPFRVERIIPGVWSLEIGREDAPDACFAIHLDEFEPRPTGDSVYERFYGLAYRECPD